MSELGDLVALIERLHVVPENRGPTGQFPADYDWDATELANCVGWSEGQRCCLDRIRESPEFQAARRAARP